MRLIVTLLFLSVLSSFTFDASPCDKEYLYGKWALIKSYDEDAITVDSLLTTNVDSLLKDEILSSDRAYMTYQKNEIAINGLTHYSTHEIYQFTKEPCRIQQASVVSGIFRFIYILHLDDTRMITLDRGRIYYYRKEKDF